MIALPGRRARLVFASVLLVPLLGASGVVNNVLLQWREQADKCEEPTQGDDGAMVAVAMFEAINAIAGKYTPYVAKIDAPKGSSIDAAAAQAAHDVLAKVCPDMQSAYDGALKRSLSLVKDSISRENGVAVGKQAAAAVIAARANSRADIKDPVMTPPAAGAYVPTIRRIGMTWSKQGPWIMKTSDELRSPPPPALTSETWRRDLAEIREMGSKKAKARRAEQTDIGQFWANKDVRIVLRQLVGLPGRSLVDDARFLALAEMAWADSYIAMMDGKYAYNFWRPITALRNARMIAGDSAAGDSGWEPMISTPPHPEYPCGHCLSAGAVGTVIAEEFGKEFPSIVLDMEKSLLRRYHSAQEYIDDVTESRILAGVHYRFSADAGRDAGVKVGKLAVERYFKRK
ncbi:MAG: vanadium-dependent haloperoxidase [Gemmatimonadaceae bacterium]